MNCVSCSGGFDFELVDEQRKEFECPICLLLLRDSRELPCAHCLCKSCLQKWEKEKGREEPKQCPTCKKEYIPDEIIRSNFLDKIIRTTINVKCKFHVAGCEWTGVIIDYYTHENSCLFIHVACQHEGCGEKVVRKDLTNHKATCVFRIVECHYCGVSRQQIQLEKHYEECLSYPTNCPNNSCGKKFPRKLLLSHTEEDCEYQQVNCEFIHVGCNLQFERKQKEEHNRTFICDHMSMLLKNSKISSARIEDLEQQKTALLDELKQTKEVLNETRTELKIKKTELMLIRQQNSARKKVSEETKEIKRGPKDVKSNNNNVRIRSDVRDL